MVGTNHESTGSERLFADGMTFSLSVFGATAFLFLRTVVQTQVPETSFHKRRRKSLEDLQQQQHRHRERNTHQLQQSKQTPTSDTSTSASAAATDRDVPIPPVGEVSARGQTALIPAMPYLRQFFACFENPCDPVHNPTGYIGLCVAENRLVTSILIERCLNPSTSMATFSDSSVYCYNNGLGMPVAREATAYFLARRFLFPEEISISPNEALQHVQPKHVALLAGAAAVLNNLFFLLGDPGDACLIPAPYYAAFENDMNLVCSIVPFPIVQANPMQGPTESELNLAFMQAKSSGLNPRFLLLTNPNNPLAVIHRPEVILRCITWARRRKMHTIVDEIYALSTHQREGHGFKSVIRILDNQLGTDVHMVWAASKDFGSSGLRYGVLYSQNELMLEALASPATFSCVSGPIQYLVSELLTDDVFVDNFLDESRRRVLYSYTICTRKLDEMVLPFIPAEAGMFVYVDFSSLLPQATFEWEEKLSELMFQVRVVLTPGESQHDSTPGMFRICYAWVAPEILEIAMERLSRLVAKLRRMEWVDVNDRALNSILYS